jgi:biopolymer transport protein ExbB/TolQ
MKTAAPHGTSPMAYPGTLAMLALALAFPIGLMVFNPTLMFERGWEQYVGTALYGWAVVTLGRELMRLWSNERAFVEAPALLGRLDARGEAKGRGLAGDDARVLPSRIRQLAHYLQESRTPSVGQLMEINREGSALDQEHLAGRFTLTRYILYLLPVIGFIGTVEGISKALMNISRVLPMVKNLDGFMSELTSVTSALQIAFDSTLLALFLSAALMLVQTLVFRRSEDLLARIDRWVVEHVLPRFGADEASGAASGQAAGEQLERLRRDLAIALEKFTAAVERLPASVAGFQRGAETIGRVGTELEALGAAGEALRKGAGSLARIEALLHAQQGPGEHLTDIKRAIDRNGAAVEALAQSLAQAYERTNRVSQEQLARTMNSLKDALDLLNVSMEQGNSLYRNIVKKMFDDRASSSGHDGIRAA